MCWFAGKASGWSGVRGICEVEKTEGKETLTEE